MELDQAIANTRAHLLSLRNAQGHWEGELSSSALSTATALVALSLVDAEKNKALIASGAQWLVQHQNKDGGWGDTTISKSNLSTTLLCWSALGLYERVVEEAQDRAEPITGRVPIERLSGLNRCEAWIHERVGSLKPDAICKAVIARYGKDKTFSVPILMTCAIGGRLGPHDEAWQRVLALPFELAALPRTWFGAVGLPVVSYALPALIAIGHARFFHAPPAWWNPLRWLRGTLWRRISPMLKTLQPSTGGYLEATPLTSFVTMALACAGEKDHPCVSDAVRFLVASQREDGSWPIDTNLATWATTLSVKALFGNADTPVRSEVDKDADRSVRFSVKNWLLAQQYKTIHPFTNAAPGGWAWTDLPGGVPDADDTSAALIALSCLCRTEEERREVYPAVEAGMQWLLGLQNRDGGIPTFCRGWGTLPFDRSTPEITAQAMLAFVLWEEIWNDPDKPCGREDKRHRAIRRALHYLEKTQHPDGFWVPLWFGNEHAPDEENPVYGTAKVLQGYYLDAEKKKKALAYLVDAQDASGGWGGAKGAVPTIEETANAIAALAYWTKIDANPLAVEKGVRWLLEKTKIGTEFPAAPIGLYFAKLWYHEKVYPVIWTLSALQRARTALELAEG